MTRLDEPAALVWRFVWLAAASFLAGFAGFMLVGGHLRWPLS